MWKHVDDHYCVVGSRTKDQQGQALLYRSKDLIDWHYFERYGKE
ncbi:hypothetical protein ACQKGI_02350 [Peribacillus muralis]